MGHGLCLHYGFCEMPDRRCILRSSQNSVSIPVKDDKQVDLRNDVVDIAPCFVHILRVRSPADHEEMAAVACRPTPILPFEMKVQWLQRSYTFSQRQSVSLQRIGW